MPTLQHALPALEKLYSSWEKASKKPHYKNFIPALTAGMKKLNTYYEQSADSDAHIMAMGEILFLIPLLLANYCVVVLDPSRKSAYFQKHWPSEIVIDVEDTILNRVCPLPSIFIITSSITLYPSSSNASTVCKAIQVQSQHAFVRSPQHASWHTLTLMILTLRMILTMVKVPHALPILGWMSGRITSTLLKMCWMVWTWSAGGGYVSYFIISYTCLATNTHML